jgi:hypothetical protein
MRFRTFLAIVLCWWLPASAEALDLTIDTSAARRVLQALQNSHLNRADALAIAALPGNAAMIEKISSFRKPASADLFADALLAAATSQASSQGMFHFDRVRTNAASNLATLDVIDQSSGDFKAWVVERVSAFSPDSLQIAAKGIIIAGGPAAGFAFHDPTAYLNINTFSGDPVAVRVIMAHEIFHAIQAIAAAAVTDRRVLSFDEKEFARLKTAKARKCYLLEAIFGEFMQEGTASYVGDVMTLTGEEGPSSKWLKKRFEEGLDSVRDSITLLDLSVIGLTATPHVSYERVYSLGFYNREPLYYPAYVVARAIAADQGPKALAAVIDQPGSEFLRRYIALPLYGKDEAHPRLGPETERWVRRLQEPCARRPSAKPTQRIK